MYCKIFKIVTGDIIIGVIEEEEINYESPTITIFDPIKVEVVRIQTATAFMDTIIVKPLLPMSSQEYIIIRTQHIIYDSFVSENYVKQYMEFVESKNSAIAQEPQKEDNSIFSSGTPNSRNDIPSENHLDLTEPDDEEVFDEQPTKRTYH